MLYLVSFCLPLLVNNKALIVYYNDSYYFPVFNYYLASTFDQPYYGETRYRELANQLAKDPNHWLVMPLYPYHPNESLLHEIEGQPPTWPSSVHFFGTDNRGRDVFVRLLYGFNMSLTFAILVTFFSYVLGVAIGAFLGYFGGCWNKHEHFTHRLGSMVGQW